MLCVSYLHLPQVPEYPLICWYDSPYKATRQAANQGLCPQERTQKCLLFCRRV